MSHHGVGEEGVGPELQGTQGVAVLKEKEGQEVRYVVWDMFV